MKKTLILLLLSTIITPVLYSGDPAALGKLLQKKYGTMRENDQAVVIIYLTDKGDLNRFKNVKANSILSSRSIRRRLKFMSADSVIDERDYPLNKQYVDLIEKNVLQLRHQLKWFNAVSVLATRKQIEAVRKYPFVSEIELVGRWKKDRNSEREETLKNEIETPQSSGVNTFNYGTSFTQVNQINVPVVHNKGIYGQGVIVGVFDNGFRILNHESFASMNIIAQRDFVDHKESVIPLNPNHGGHGVNTLSTIGGFKEGQLIGPAFRADYILARTENDSSETPIEEDNWAAAIEWGDSIGVDVTSTSLGYLTYAPPYISWTWLDMDGNTTLITKAADHAVSLGIVVVNSAGNNGLNAEHNTLNGPADGDSVISAGGVISSGARWISSSVGPTTDFPPRIKPDVMAMSSGVKVASSVNPIGYGTSSGTSFSCPLSAGVAALILSANPELNPMQVREAMRQTASNAATPDNLMGWGILNADSAIRYFGILPMGAISGSVYADLNSNGTMDPGDTSLAGIKIMITGTATDSTYSDSEGNYKFDSLAIGEYYISQEVPDDWKQTNPATVHYVNLLHRVDTSGFDFGNFQLATIQGFKFNDLNSNGSQDDGEYGMDNWVFRLSDGDTTYRAVTQNGGIFTFTDVDTGTYFLSESIQVGWFQTIPPGFGSYTITIQRHLDTSGFIFGNYYMPDSAYQISEGWNLLSFPKLVSDYSIEKYYTTAASDLFIYNNSYIDVDTIPPKTGYWLKSSATQNVIIQGSPRLLDTINLTKGWNLIGSIDDTISLSSIEQIPDTVMAAIFAFNGGIYEESPSELYPHHGYWIKARTDGKIVMNASWKGRLSGVIEPLINISKQQNYLLFTESSNREQKLYFGSNLQNGLTQRSYELPPPPPEGIYDVRFNDNLTLISAGEKQYTKEIIIQSGDYPINVRWSASDIGATLNVDGNHIELIKEGNYVIKQKPERISITLVPTAKSKVPETFSLGQNFPNPLIRQ